MDEILQGRGVDTSDLFNKMASGNFILSPSPQKKRSLSLPIEPRPLVGPVIGAQGSPQLTSPCTPPPRGAGVQGFLDSVNNTPPDGRNYMTGTPVESRTLEERITATELRQAAQEINSTSRPDSNAGSDISYQILEKVLERQRALVETVKDSKPKPGSEDHLAQTF